MVERVKQRMVCQGEGTSTAGKGPNCEKPFDVAVSVCNMRAERLQRDGSKFYFTGTVQPASTPQPRYADDVVHHS